MPDRSHQTSGAADSRTLVESLPLRVAGSVEEHRQVFIALPFDAGVTGVLLFHFAFGHDVLRQRERTNMPVIFCGECSTR